MNRMFRWAAAAVLVAAVLASPVSAETDGAPAASVGAGGPEHHFATVVEGTTVVHDFVLENRGTAELEINKVKTG